MRAVVLVALAGCSSHVNSEYCAKHFTDHQYCPWLDGGVTIDAPPLCQGPGMFATCVPGPTAPVTLPMDLDTDLSPLCLTTQPAMWKAAGQVDACFVVGTTITVDTRAHGGRPLVLFASDAITVTSLDVSSTHAGTTPIGAGFDASACGTFAATPGSDSNGGGGGAGGTFYLNTGGNGGLGGGGGIAQGKPAPPETMMPTKLRGGCPGQNGGGGNGGGAGVGGIGGGGVLIVAANSIDLSNATINASGAGGGNGTTNNGGGGGGGSGGMIILNATTIGATGAKLLANGGGGGGVGSSAQPGADPSPTTPMTPATGGTQQGGNGFGGPTNATSGQVGSGGTGGGGGGGGGGYIQTNHVLSTTTVSPMPVTI